MEEATNAPLARFTTLKIGGEATRLCHPRTLDELVELVGRLEQRGEPWFIIGGGSNLLISSAGVKGTVIRTAYLTEINNPEPDVIEAAAGARLPHMAKQAAHLGLSGLEFAVGIPGTAGGAVIMNAGAHGSCIANILESATVYDTEEGDLKVYKAEELDFVYRACKLKPDKHVVVSARFRLQKGDASSIEEATRHNEDYRWRTQPIGWPNAGSTFKNPEPERAAGYLLDQAGAKNLKEGQAAVSAIHANFVINLGKATSTEVTSLLQRMQACVYDSYAIRLKPEWKTLGEFGAEEMAVWEK
ncbi:MAG: UDP-N-acetylmuramate dehydrogenase [Candidatus Melainabacteria bacterium]|nr:UDP-N-acetylmuramate dehydrogenase [Candidatus Melainabacteria bacterium]